MIGNFGPITSVYKQIGNAVPVNLAFAVARSLVRLLNEMDSKKPNYGNLDYKEGENFTLPLAM